MENDKRLSKEELRRRYLEKYGYERVTPEIPKPPKELLERMAKITTTPVIESKGRPVEEIPDEEFYFNQNPELSKQCDEVLNSLLGTDETEE